jgi:hypothetical protein
VDHITIVKVLQLIRPGSAYNVRGSQIEWLDQNTAEPTSAELAAGLAQVEALSYREKRAKEYPSIGDQLDALWKGGADAAAMKTKIDAVKAKYPKPEGL